MTIVYFEIFNKCIMRNKISIKLITVFLGLSYFSAFSQNCRPLSGEKYYLKTKTLNLRTQPDKKSEIITILDDKNYSLVVVNEDSIVNNFILVKAIRDSFNYLTYKKVVIDEKLGWVYSDFVDFDGDNMHYFARTQGRSSEEDILKIITEEEELKLTNSCRYNPTRLSYAYRQSGINLFDSENYIEAIKKFNISIELATVNSIEHKLISIYYRARCKMNLGDNRGAINDFKTIKSEKTTKVGNTLVIGWSHKTDNHKVKMPGFNIPMIDLEIVHLDLAICNARLKNFAEAQTEVNTVLLNNKKSGNAYYVNAQIYLAQNFREKSCLAASKAGELGIEEAYDFISENCK
jgi:hypothetical protein